MSEADATSLYASIAIDLKRIADSLNLMAHPLVRVPPEVSTAAEEYDGDGGQHGDGPVAPPPSSDNSQRFARPGSRILPSDISFQIKVNKHGFGMVELPGPGKIIDINGDRIIFRPDPDPKAPPAAAAELLKWEYPWQARVIILSDAPEAVFTFTETINGIERMSVKHRDPTKRSGDYLVYEAADFGKPAFRSDLGPIIEDLKR